jgi:hypothetical protein
VLSILLSIDPDIMRHPQIQLRQITLSVNDLQTTDKREVRVRRLAEFRQSFSLQCAT